MTGELAVGAMDCLALLAGKLDLTAGLDRDRSALAAQRQDASVLLLGLVSVALDQPAHDLLDSAGAGKGQGPAVMRRNRDFFVFAADSPLGTRLRPGFEIAHQLLFAFQQVAHKRQTSKSAASCCL